MRFSVLRGEDPAAGELRVELGDCGMDPGLGTVLVSVRDGSGREVVPEHRYQFDVHEPRTLDRGRYVEEPRELPDLPAFLVLGPFRRRLGERGNG